MSQPALELWGGIECTVNRVGGNYHDQLRFSGHWSRASDLHALAELGLRALRYPVLWEHAAPARLDDIDLTWADERLQLLRQLELSPVVGLLHHGSGPAYTSLLDGQFPEKLAAYAGAVARRYPWIRRYTPVNEPLTTARFSALYGHWYPHHRSDRAFARALLNQVWGTILAMRAIRREVPDAELVHTEDLGCVRSTSDLRYQAAFENERRFLGLDLLYGRVDRQHPLYGFLKRAGIRDAELERLRAEPCVPAVLGFNYYVTGERFLDSRVSLYPRHVVGGNGRRRYADVEAVRICAEGLVGPAKLLAEAHERYQTPLAVTEAHLGGEPRGASPLVFVRMARCRSSSPCRCAGAGRDRVGAARLLWVGSAGHRGQLFLRARSLSGRKRRARLHAVRRLLACGRSRHALRGRGRLVAPRRPAAVQRGRADGARRSAGSDRHQR